ncbi:helix-turn-helix transcriptional regulator [Saccharothrix longispora]|uniref:helix-turn-helix transcriptional regulator n=1 Tax=Saccharothrix longispora TaxID=33920 RepID=UPI0028FD9899|nr:helix-turn-helix transcriptional regulator [Saccharothrix longispora]MBY8850639.1 helix-turn-helix domain-containing protein [Saccharothrix sp. MB29]MDU0292402.1 helix-turn-helix transcriptional regulator [Saccharothrix longispora]
MTTASPSPVEEGVAVPDEPQPIGKLIPELRRGRGLTQHDLAARLHAASGNASVTREEVSRWERGKRIPGPYWRAWLGRVLDTPARDLDQAAAVARWTRRRG